MDKIIYKFYISNFKFSNKKNVNKSIDTGAIGFFLFFVILIIIWIFAMGGCVKERKSFGVYEGLETYQSYNNCLMKCFFKHKNSPTKCKKCRIECCKKYDTLPSSSSYCTYPKIKIRISEINQYNNILPCKDYP